MTWVGQTEAQKVANYLRFYVVRCVLAVIFNDGELLLRQAKFVDG